MLQFYRVMKMIVILFGVSNVGKTTTGKELAKELEVPFYDVDEYIKKEMHLTMDQFMEKYSNDRKRDDVVGEILQKLVSYSDNSVISSRSNNFTTSFESIIEQDNVLPIHIKDSPIHIFDRLVFADENDVIYKDDEYKLRYKKHYMNDILADIYYYSNIYKNIESKYFINNKPPKQCAKELADLIRNNEPIKIKVDINDIIEGIFEGWSEVSFYYNTISLEIIRLEANDRSSDQFFDLVYNRQIFIKLPTFEDFDDYGTLDGFIETIKDDEIKNKLMIAKEDLDHDFYVDIQELGVDRKWNDFHDEALKQFAMDWCKENDIDYE